MCDFYFFFVSTFQKNDYCKNHLLNVENAQTKKSTIEIMIKFLFFITMSWSTSKTEKSTLNRMSFKQTHWLTDFERENLQLSRFVDLKMLYVNFIQLTKTSCFVIFQQENFTFWRFCFKRSRIFTNDWILFKFAYSCEQLTLFFNFAYFYELFGDFILFIRVFRRAIYSRQRIWRVSINFAKFWARNLAVLKTWKWFRHRHCNW